MLLSNMILFEWINLNNEILLENKLKIDTKQP